MDNDDKKENTEAEKKLEECERQKQEYLSGWQRARADFLNYKREELERIQGLIGYAKEEFILKLMPILDSFAHAEKAMSENSQKDGHVEGISKIKELLRELLAHEGVQELSSLGQKFDPNYHEVVGTEDAGGTESGTIVEEVQKGYTINGRVLRPAKVKVAK